MLDLDLSGRHALVCGASQGIGRATAFALAEHGADVTVLARSRELLEALAATLPKRDGQRHGFLVADLRDRAALRTSVAALAAERPVAILVNNTGGPPGGPITSSSAAVISTDFPGDTPFPFLFAASACGFPCFALAAALTRAASSSRASSISAGSTCPG